MSKHGALSATTHLYRVRARSVIAAGAVIVTIGAGAGLSGAALAANQGRASGAPVVIGMVDTGVNANHQEFTYDPSIAGPNGQFVAWWDFSTDASGHQPLPGQLWDTSEPHPFDPNGHGTNTASMAAGKNVTAGKTKSFAPGYKLSIAKVGDSTGAISGDLAKAIRWQVDTAHADIISMSIGEVAPLPAAVSQLIFDSFAYARQHGVLVVVANGNGFANAGGPGERGWATGSAASTNGRPWGAQDPIYTY